MIQNKINNLVFTAIFVLYNRSQKGHKKVKMVLEVEFQEKNKIQTMRLCNAKK